MKYVQLTQSKMAQVDDEDFERINQWNWNVQKCKNDKWYAQRSSPMVLGKRHAILMHREIIHVPKGMEVDHIDGNGLNNQRYNLRICTTSQNQANTKRHIDNLSGYKGVSKSKKKWRAQIKINKRTIVIGSFETPEEAARAYDKVSKENFGEFAYLNFHE